MNCPEDNIQRDHEALGGVRLVVRFRSGHRLELTIPEAVSSGGGSYSGSETAATLTSPDRSTTRRSFASAAALLQQLGLPAPTSD